MPFDAVTGAATSPSWGSVVDTFLSAVTVGPRGFTWSTNILEHLEQTFLKNSYFMHVWIGHDNRFYIVENLAQ